MKEVQMNTSSLTFKSINTRGFTSVANQRFLQLVDGMDNSSPLLGFALGNLVGMSELDVQSIELLPGASSALYGANAFNGVLFMNSQNPFAHHGITSYYKYGQTNQKAAGSNNFYDFGIRVAHKFNNYFAAKANFSYMQGTDWHATDYNDLTGANIDRSNPSYDGVNIYGDAISTNIYGITQKLVAATALPPSVLSDPILTPTLNKIVSRTGYKEVDLTDNKVNNTKVNFALYVKPFANDFEISWESRFGFGKSVYEGANRYALDNFFIQQHKIEFKAKNFLLRGYTTMEDGGKSYDMNFAGINIQEIGKPRSVWFPQYTIAYITAFNTPGTTFQNEQLSHNAARTIADAPSGGYLGLIAPGTTDFKNAFSKVVNEADVTKGAKLVDNSRTYHADLNYNLIDLIKVADIQIGGSFRQYQLNSHGRIFTDAINPIIYNEYSAYAQYRKKLFDEKLKITASLRHDKSQNFKGSYSPRASIVYTVDDNKMHTIRGSFQTGFRNPATQDQYIGFNVGSAMLLGSAPDNLTRYSETLPVSTATGQLYAGGTTATIDGNNAYFNSYSLASVQAFATFAATNPSNLPGAAALLKRTDIDLVKPEQVKSFELGYRGEYRGYKLDVNGYYNIYNDFIGNQTSIAPLYGKATNFTNSSAFLNPLALQSLHALANNNYRAFQLYTNSAIQINSLGFGAGLNKRFNRMFDFFVNYNYAEFDYDQTQDLTFKPAFNTPKHRAKIGISADKIADRFGFNTSVRWSDSYLWQSSFGDGRIAAATVIDAQINYTALKLKSTFKIGATNLGGKEYNQVLGAGMIGQQYYISWSVNP
jgi:outer membrane receptor protein involved in Fe transport